MTILIFISELPNILLVKLSDMPKNWVVISSILAQRLLMVWCIIIMVKMAIGTNGQQNLERSFGPDEFQTHRPGCLTIPGATTLFVPIIVVNDAV